MVCSMVLFESLLPAEKKTLEALAEEYAAFRLTDLNGCVLETLA